MGNIIAESDNVVVAGHLQADTATSLAYGSGGSVGFSVPSTAPVETTLITQSYTAIVGNFIVDASFDMAPGSSQRISNYTFQFNLYLDGALVRSTNPAPIALAIDGGGFPTFNNLATSQLMQFISTTPGAHTIEVKVWVRNTSGGTVGFTVSNSQLRILESMR